MKAVTVFRQRSIGIGMQSAPVGALEFQKVGIHMTQKGTSSGRIDLFNTYVILVSPDCYSLYKRGVAKNGNEWLGSIGYYGTMDKALKGCKADYVRRNLMEHRNMSLDEAISIIIQSNNHFESLIKNAFEGVES